MAAALAAAANAATREVAANRQEQIAQVKRIFREARQYGNASGSLSFKEVRVLLIRCTPKGEKSLSEADVRTLFDAIDRSRNGRIEFEEFVNFLTDSGADVSPARDACCPPLAATTDPPAEQERALNAAVLFVRRQMGALDKKKTVVCVLGSTKFSCPDTEELIRLTAVELQVLLPLGKVCFVTGGMPGAQQVFAASCPSDVGTGMWHLVPQGLQSGFGAGTDLQAGTCMEEKQAILAHVGDVYLTFEGGPGVAKEARFANARGAVVIPLSRTGGASGGMFDFPKVEIPRSIKDPEVWELLSRSEAPIAHSARAAAQIAASMAVS
mmetsp:Transcript_89445/g.225730  ORF Transcript_89445/g.225730 Transcript_89445/m.225730 type:complete len:325 (-) Transcript_89445:59-1033(-)